MELQESFLNNASASMKRLDRVVSIFKTLMELGKKTNSPVLYLNETPYFNTIIENFGPCLENPQVDLHQIYEVAFHVKTSSIIVANTGLNLLCLSPATSTSHIVRQIACSVYRPNLGVESVNIGIVGNIYQKDVVLRSESACPPSFLFGSQRCNCCYQWASIREVAAHFNTVEPPKELAGEDLWRWVKKQFHYENRKHLPARDGKGFILMHLDSQAGMGSGVTPKEFVFDLYSRALMRHLGEATVEQTLHTSMKESFEALGVMPDPRQAENQAGYEITYVLLDWLQAHRELIVLSNNSFKLNQLQENGYQVKRVKSLGKIDRAGLREAEQRGPDFDQMDMDGEEISFEEEIHRLRCALTCHPSEFQLKNDQ